MKTSITKKIASAAVAATMVCSAVAVSAVSAAEVKNETPKTFSFSAAGPEIANSQVSIYLWNSKTGETSGEYGSTQMHSVTDKDGKISYYTYQESQKEANEGFDRVIFKVNDNKTADLDMPAGDNLQYVTTYINDGHVDGRFMTPDQKSQEPKAEPRTFDLNGNAGVDLSNTQVSIYLWNSKTGKTNGEFGSVQMHSVTDESGKITGYTYTETQQGADEHFDRVIFKVNDSQSSDLEIPANGNTQFLVDSLADGRVNGHFVTPEM